MTVVLHALIVGQKNYIQSGFYILIQLNSLWLGLVASESDPLLCSTFLCGFLYCGT